MDKFSLDSASHVIPRIAIRSIAGGLFLMAFFTMMWTGISQIGLDGQDHRIVLVVFSVFALVFILAGIRLFTVSGKFPKNTTDEHRAQGKKMGKSFGIIFGIEGVAIPVVSVILKVTGFDLFILPAIALVVGLHFFPMARIFNRRIDYYVATWTCLVALASIYMTARGTYPQAFIYAYLGIGIALATTAYGVYMLIAGNRLAGRH